MLERNVKRHPESNSNCVYIYTYKMCAFTGWRKSSKKKKKNDIRVERDGAISIYSCNSAVSRVYGDRGITRIRGGKGYTFYFWNSVRREKLTGF